MAENEENKVGIPRCIICGAELPAGSRAKYCARCRNTYGGRHLPFNICIRVTEEEKEFWRGLSKEQRSILSDKFRHELRALMKLVG